MVITFTVRCFKCLSDEDFEPINNLTWKCTKCKNQIIKFHSLFGYYVEFSYQQSIPLYHTRSAYDERIGHHFVVQPMGFGYAAKCRTDNN